MAVKALPGGLQGLAIIVRVAGGKGDVTFQTAQAKLEHNAYARIHLGHIGNALPFDFKIFIKNGGGQAVDDVVFVINGTVVRAEAGTKFFVATVERRPETVIV